MFDRQRYIELLKQFHNAGVAFVSITSYYYSDENHLEDDIELIDFDDNEVDIWERREDGFYRKAAFEFLTLDTLDDVANFLWGVAEELFDKPGKFRFNTADYSVEQLSHVFMSEPETFSEGVSGETLAVYDEETEDFDFVDPDVGDSEAAYTLLEQRPGEPIWRPGLIGRPEFPSTNNSAYPLIQLAESFLEIWQPRQGEVGYTVRLTQDIYLRHGEILLKGRLGKVTETDNDTGLPRAEFAIDYGAVVLDKQQYQALYPNSLRIVNSEGEEVWAYTDHDAAIHDTYAPYRIEWRAALHLERGVDIETLPWLKPDVPALQLLFTSINDARKAVAAFNNDESDERLFDFRLLDKDGNVAWSQTAVRVTKLKGELSPFTLPRQASEVHAIYAPKASRLADDQVLLELTEREVAMLNWGVEQTTAWATIVDFGRRWFGEAAVRFEPVITQEYDDQEYYDDVTDFNAYDAAGNTLSRVVDPEEVERYIKEDLQTDLDWQMQYRSDAPFEGEPGLDNPSFMDWYSDFNDDDAFREDLNNLSASWRGVYEVDKPPTLTFDFKNPRLFIAATVSEANQVRANRREMLAKFTH